MLNINLLQLQAFVLSAELGSFSAAARKLRKTHSAISMTVSNLELDLNQELFDRSTRNPSLTAAGETLYREAKLILGRCQHFEQLARELEPQQESQIIIALDSAYNVPQERELLSFLDKYYPELELKLIERSSEDVISHIVKGEADIGFTLLEQPIFSNLHSIALPEAEQLYVAAPDHPLAALEQVTISDLQKYRQASLQRRSEQRLTEISSYQWKCDSVVATTVVAQYGLAWTMAVRPFLRKYLESGSLVELNVVADLKRSIPASLIWRTDKGDGIIHTAIRQLIREHSVGS
ncbi:LysR family transcriptional regulator [Vibrio maritimus]|uniref:LysR family transcriptional regulator n=1 Tax=Vibrio maritimus TaxID=990268 RepID=UPI0037362947